MARYRARRTPGDNLRDLYQKQANAQLNDALGNSSIDDEGSLDVTNSDTTVAKIGHDGTKHGFLVPNGGGWQTVQEDAQARADALNAAMDVRMDAVELGYNNLEADMFAANNDIISIKQRLNAIEDYIAAHPAPGYTPPWA